jgi:hypothetical protein
VVLTDAARAAVTMPRQDTAEAARAETQLGGEVGTRPPAKSGGAGAVALGLLGVLVVGGGAAAFFLRGPAERPVEPSAQARAAEPPGTVSVAPELPPTPSVTVAAPQPSVPVVPPPSSVKLEVITDPPGAMLTKGGFQVCEATPCDVTASINEALELQAEKGVLKGKVKVLAQKDQKVTIKLAAPVAAPAVKPAKPQCEVMVGDLKILRDCPD